MLSNTLVARLMAALLAVSSGPALAAEPELPRTYLDTAYPPLTGRTIAVASGGDFQAALDAAQPGDEIVLEAGATFAGPFALPKKVGTGWIVVRSSAVASLAPPGTRVRPSDAAAMPKVVTQDSRPAIQTAPGAHHYRFIGVEFAVAPGVRINYGIVLLGDGSGGQFALDQVPHDLILDRCYIHGQPTGDVSRGVALNSASTAIIDSYISEIHGWGFDTQAIAGWNGPGPFKIVNNYLEGAGENLMFGGADPAIRDLVPSDIEIRGNHFSKPLAWRIGDPTYAGTPWTVKNLFELKNARRVLVEGNIFEHNWVHGQSGFAILFTVRNQSGTAPWSVVEDVTFTNNIVRHTARGINILGRDTTWPSGSQQTKRVKIRNNVFDDVDAARWGGGCCEGLFQLLEGTADMVIENNTAVHSDNVITAEGAPHTGFVYRDNITPHNAYGVIGSGYAPGNSTLSRYFPEAAVVRNVLAGGDASYYPPDNFFPASLDDVSFVNRASGDYRLAPWSSYKNAGTDGRDPGVDLDGLEAATAGAITGSTGIPDSPPPADATQAGDSPEAQSPRVEDSGGNPAQSPGTTVTAATGSSVVTSVTSVLPIPLPSAAVVGGGTTAAAGSWGASGPPAVSVAVWSVGEELQIDASASGNAALSELVAYVNGYVVGTTTCSGTACALSAFVSWWVLYPGLNTITAVAVDASGITGESGPYVVYK